MADPVAQAKKRAREWAAFMGRIMALEQQQERIEAKLDRLIELAEGGEQSPSGASARKTKEAKA